MTPIEIPNAKGLREFGLVTGALLVGLFGLLFPLAFNLHFPTWPWLVAGILWLWAGFHPQSLRPVYYVWMKLGQALGWINTRLVLGIIFYLIITPMGLTKRFLSHNPLHPPTVVHNSYRRPTSPRPPKHMEYPF